MSRADLMAVLLGVVAGAGLRYATAPMPIAVLLGAVVAVVALAVNERRGER